MESNELSERKKEEKCEKVSEQQKISYEILESY